MARRSTPRRPGSRAAAASPGGADLSAKLYDDAQNAWRAGRHDKAARLLRRLIRHHPGKAELQVTLGQVLEAAGDPRGALRAYRQAASAQPGLLAAWFNQANLLYRTGQARAAIDAYAACTRIRPDFAEAWGNLGVVYWDLSMEDQAIACYRRALDANPGFAEAHNNLGGALLQHGDAAGAVAEFEQAIALRPDYIEAWQHLGNALMEQGRYERCLAACRKAVALGGGDSARIRLAATVPMFPESTAQIREVRARMERELDALLEQPLSVGDPVAENGKTNFFLAYHGLCNRDLQRKYAQVYERACPALLYTAPHCRDPVRRDRPERIRVGLISMYFENHSIGNTSRGFFERLSRDRFTVVALFLGQPSEDETSAFIQAHADEMLIVPNDLARAREMIADLKLDVLFYQDMGMEPFSYFLAYARLAPVQCTSFGHPDTSGIRNLDYFVSTDHYETSHGDDHYSETLFRLHGLSSCAWYRRPPLPDRLRPRADYGLPDDLHTYICPQTLFKFHPDFDALLGGILRADPDGIIVLIEGKHPDWGEIIRARFAKTIPDVADRIRFVPHQPGRDFINLIAVCDVMLDTIHFCGQNTSHAGFSAGVPIVTLPGELHRSRHTLAFYRQMGVMDCVARDEREYVDIAVRLGTDAAWREQVRARIRAARGVIWEDDRVIREFERFFIESVEAARSA